jgi:hypothetical protein
VIPVVSHLWTPPWRDRSFLVLVDAGRFKTKIRDAKRVMRPRRSREPWQGYR